MKKEALGRGLDALFGEIEEAYENEGSQQDVILEISLKDIVPNPYQPRKTFNEESLQELSNSIKEDGLIQPIVVKEDIDSYIIIAGERRFRASKLAKLKTIKAIVINSNESKMRQYALIENIHRDELNSIELANSYEELLKLYAMTHEELATKISKSRTHITNSIRLLQLTKKTQKALLEKKITAGHAKVMVGLNDKEQQLIINSIVGQKLSVREVESIIKDIKNRTNPEPKTIPTTSYDFSQIKSKFDNLGFKNKISNNKITIEFKDETQIEQFLEHFSS